MTNLFGENGFILGRVIDINETHAVLQTSTPFSHVTPTIDQTFTMTRIIYIHIRVKSDYIYR